MHYAYKNAKSLKIFKNLITHTLTECIHAALLQGLTSYHYSDANKEWLKFVSYSNRTHTKHRF